jgi:hypothetical protein
LSKMETEGKKVNCLIPPPHSSYCTTQSTYTVNSAVEQV